ncbi:glycogen/starch/alpha-glucan phosphorylase [Zongyangia hominis]|uniref:Alpha-1,4 glucan phosphorylase n=1 Tax=Zongyangia hominis TaxID=2763677 RepID=A0A926ICG6_9FIRM|nr:glycogen/starch/alpha-glucan phosphorylase [Zongyangia hominis]MBC8571338.1 glycogen/starch/alpha-glucan phosphorylase [Zongyangia hominis]
MNKLFTSDDIKNKLITILDREFNETPATAPDKIFYKACAMILQEVLSEKRKKFASEKTSHGQKRVYYLCMEFLMGRSLKNNIYNLELVDEFKTALASFGVKLENLYECEPDAGLGNGGLGRLAACYLDGMATQEYLATGHSILYEYGIFKQRIIDGWQTELPDNWLPGGDVWLAERLDRAVDVHFGGEIQEFWDHNYHHINHVGYSSVKAVPYDMYVSGYRTKGVSRLRLWKAVSPGIDMEMFNKGDYVRALGQNSYAEAISKVLYPNDNHLEGKNLRLRQQYFLVAASIGDIVHSHLMTYGTLENLSEKVAIHINDTHPVLAIPELMRILLDDCGYSWDKAWAIVTRTFAYTNHTVMNEALERWNEDLFKLLLPRIYQIVVEINNRFTRDLFERWHKSVDQINRLSIIYNHEVRMANLAVWACHSVNGVSKLHSDILKDDLFHEFYEIEPKKFKNVTNGIAARRWLYQSNPGLTNLISELIGDSFIKHMSKLEKLKKYADDESVLQRFAQIKRENKENFAHYLKEHTGVVLNPDSIFDVQVKRLHEYKRQHLNALHILSLYQKLKQNPGTPFTPRTFIFGAKAAPGYYMAKQIIRFICDLGRHIDNDPDVRGRIKVVYLEDYNVTMSEMLAPASEISEQISLAGTEASGTGNMKLMLAGAVTLGTYDGANVEIYDSVGDENFIRFGMSTEQVRELKPHYNPRELYNKNPEIKGLIDTLYKGFDGNTFEEIATSLATSDPYMVLADFEAYKQAQIKAEQLYSDTLGWQRMSLINVANAGMFSADRSVDDYARDIWGLV